LAVCIFLSVFMNNEEAMAGFLRFGRDEDVLSLCVECSGNNCGLESALHCTKCRQGSISELADAHLLFDDSTYPGTSPAIKTSNAAIGGDSDPPDLGWPEEEEEVRGDAAAPVTPSEPAPFVVGFTSREAVDEAMSSSRDVTASSLLRSFVSVDLRYGP
jgi:hypothetical protein